MKFDKRRHKCLLTEDGLWHLTNERDRLLSIHLPNIRTKIAACSDGERNERLTKEKERMLKRVLWFNQRINYHVPLSLLQGTEQNEGVE